MLSCIRATAAKWEASATSAPGQPILVDADLPAMTLRIAAHAVFGEDLGSVAGGEERAVKGEGGVEAELVLQAFKVYFETAAFEMNLKDLIPFAK